MVDSFKAEFGRYLRETDFHTREEGQGEITAEDIREVMARTMRRVAAQPQ